MCGLVGNDGFDWIYLGYSMNKVVILGRLLHSYRYTQVLNGVFELITSWVPTHLYDSIGVFKPDPILR